MKKLILTTIKENISPRYILLAKYILIPLIIISAFFSIYQQLTIALGGIGYGWDKTALVEMPLELVLVISVYYGFFCLLKDNGYRYFVALLPIFSIYLFYDYYFISFGKVFKFCDFSELPELIDVLPFWQITLYITIILHILFIIWINAVNLWYRYLPLLLICSSAAFIVIEKPLWYLKDIHTYLTRFDVIPWSDQGTAQNGYFVTILYFESAMSHSKDIAKHIYGDGVVYEKSQEQLIQFLKEKNNKQNVHIIMLESFFNPRLFNKINYDNVTYSKDFSNLLNNNESSVISPVFGGFTAQAEFEVLCGTPALHSYSSIEFNSFTGANVFCMPHTLKNAGYKVVATNAYKPSFFNTINAYKGIGFDEINFPKQYSSKMNTYLSLVDNSEYMFDGDLLTQNLAFIKSHIEQKNHVPLFNYVLGVYGHMPFILDETRHPLRLKATANNKPLNDEFQRATNQIYYRTQALADYISALIKLDPNSLIIMMGDHVPKLGGIQFYKDMAYRNNEENNYFKPAAFFIVNSQFVKKQNIHQYDMITIVFDYLSNGEYCKQYACQRSEEQLKYLYNMNMARALR